MATLEDDEHWELPPLSPSMEQAFSETLTQLSEMERGDEIKLELSAEQRNWLQDEDDTFSVRMATPPPSLGRNQEELGEMSPSDKHSTGCNDTPEAKRARRTAIEKKSRQRRQQMLKRMREEVKQLEAVYAELTRRKGLEHSGGLQLRAYRSFSALSTAELQHKYSELVLVAHALEEDQVALRELLQSHELFEQKMTCLTDGREAERALWDDGIPPSSSYSVEFRQLSPAECYTIVRETYQEIQRFSEGDNFQSSGASFMGWTDKRKYDPKLGALQFGFTKLFPLDTPEQLLAQTWKIFSNGPKMAQMSFDSSVRTRFEVLQVLNENLFIIRRDHKIPSMPVTFASVQVIFRLETPTGYTMCMRTISAPEIQNAMEPHEYFYDVFHWTRFNQVHDEDDNPAGCEIMSGGSVKDQNQLQSTYWLFEIMCSVLRWEHATYLPFCCTRIRRVGISPCCSDDKFAEWCGYSCKYCRCEARCTSCCQQLHSWVSNDVTTTPLRTRKDNRGDKVSLKRAVHETRFEVLQVLNEDMIIMRRDHKIPHFPSTFTSVQVFFRLQTPTGYTVCVRSFPSPEIKEALEPHEYLFDVFHWTHYNRLYDEYDNLAGCEIVTAGSIEQTNLRSNFWLFELVCSVMRWESLTIAPLFTIET